jgi:hypothetical protein
MCDSGLTPETLTVPALLPNARPRTSDTSSTTGWAAGRNGDPSPIFAEGRGRGTARDTTGDRFDWPGWVPTDVRAAVEHFYSWHGNAPGWRRSAVQNDAPALGERVCLHELCRACDEPPTARGRFVFAWNNIGRVIADDGTILYVSFFTDWRTIQDVRLEIDPALLATPSTCSTPAACLAVGQCAGRCWRVGA